jgi:hypothetical protein
MSPKRDAPPSLDQPVYGKALSVPDKSVKDGMEGIV